MSRGIPPIGVFVAGLTHVNECVSDCVISGGKIRLEIVFFDREKWK